MTSASFECGFRAKMPEYNNDDYNHQQSIKVIFSRNLYYV